ncbi:MULTISPECIES: hypothetical protein [Streptomyces]|uniref:Uncharacterized protein n=1 Tax=Streptomyces albus TaxID=1888 RepID=A0A8H1L0W5_9ACTN|nr:MULTISPECIES: hypothetical protein [Streptomyces]EPD94744.1 hypothetical protein HMPREF1486_02558 [Streptomyces sp. HPH0547]TGG75644.1 hypothetical protein D8771_32045 [Streptomyces albus]UVN55097.1 hypothetical protein NR995_11625 [Streptomyces albus]GHJ19372.1 hypothetical protein TPA0909_09860 [Streptomyces albus]
MSPTQTTLAQVLPLAAKDLDENKVTPGVLGFVVFAVIGLAVWMLMKSMNKHMKRVDFTEQPLPDGAAAGPAGNSGGAVRADRSGSPKKGSTAEAAGSGSAAKPKG